ncbi:hypothetical protein A2763_03850 [Candidatus Kaiserbacteria bacterium RIFCSPHIGHO2_01_FULL_54_36]|uniref:Asparagine synthetase domain-containing protein n=1 Tax=Candidatus Kaiserbacteria bacterium RIFCSPHIGHO2_01_FULL_54_36 TaxID=1798482 RepID=A0A1F6CKC8_9BACT|nr:MAG: hypothetical protein A2763_03850 [Candidatus Kaiserbacteria bacterium RIFCSPHIGHO2_01_FULL_54_36]OGG75614.1 MAG: hypothetical protein A3A41_00660 [Candidatus Kaiserbacteria bacterium RIFCSPLOWO2_01_FULL_54_22]
MTASRFIQYNATILKRPENIVLPGMATFTYFGPLFKPGIVPIDRTGTIRTPIRTAVVFPIPELRPFKKTFEEICNERARDLLSRAKALDTRIYVFWSGGIDSTLVLISLLKEASTQEKKRITVLLTDESIAENPRFYADHIAGKLDRASTMMYPYLFGEDCITVSGEQNDQVFGSGAVGRLMRRFGEEIIHRPYERDVLFTFFNEIAKDAGITNLYLDLFDKLMSASPVPIRSYLAYVWWINFSLKWQNTFMRILTCVPERNASAVTWEYVNTRYFSFYGTDDFQLWSMHNLDKRIKDTWNSYKWPCKDIIYAYTKDADYRDGKTKRGSLRNVVRQQIYFDFIDESMRFYKHLEPSVYYEPDNDFILSHQRAS